MKRGSPLRQSLLETLVSLLCLRGLPLLIVVCLSLCCFTGGGGLTAGPYNACHKSGHQIPNQSRFVCMPDCIRLPVSYRDVKKG